MPRGEMKAKNRRIHAEPESHDFWEVLSAMGMPLLYIGALVAGTVGTISMGVISRFWSDLKSPMCFLYSKTASNLIVYHFGTNVATCTWVTYGAVTALVLGFLTAIVYWIKVRGEEEIDAYITLVVVGIVITTLFMLAVSCTMAEGMRLTCAAMDLNSANNKGSDCYEKLDIRVSQYNLPVDTSTMVRSSIIGLWTSTVFFFIITCFHLAEHYHRSLK
ncbi:uncharacterized protein [Procambarus clarkii]|uniref:uncharacterized protein n=1 Tax=Procambarus clarkii TaxID=6728 RepID=UPI001E676B00|nr:uncharacterized protein LOC123747453 [Procambarus clarkii]